MMAIITIIITQIAIIIKRKVNILLSIEKNLPTVILQMLPIIITIILLLLQIIKVKIVKFLLKIKKSNMQKKK